MKLSVPNPLAFFTSKPSKIDIPNRSRPKSMRLDSPIRLEAVSIALKKDGKITREIKVIPTSEEILKLENYFFGDGKYDKGLLEKIAKFAIQKQDFEFFICCVFYREFKDRVSKMDVNTIYSTVEYMANTFFDLNSVYALNLGTDNVKLVKAWKEVFSKTEENKIVLNQNKFINVMKDTATSLRGQLPSNFSVDVMYKNEPQVSVMPVRDKEYYDLACMLEQQYNLSFFTTDTSKIDKLKLFRLSLQVQEKNTTSQPTLTLK